ncbi:adenylate cyclase, class 1 [Methylomarinovum tepidoasis]|uniref:Adenylate cyclase, class 1 n=1 Tax=Methylomarinovum tepidoasis TaxID=2840183 RepID=A0AAU9C9A0_9GAMM|nr:class I adenylate cyclase [Methylomarinovum sp. IN45]BCX88472.1 adenylate cyclase, class 1 [Methylomarinovum sp. IN45]
MNRARAIRLAAPGGEISRRDLNHLIRRFLHFHRQRLQLLADTFSPRQRDALALLPLLLHQHHPALPGYDLGPAPAGIRDYRPDPFMRRAARRHFPGLDHRLRGHSEAPLLALFLMGSVGSIAFSRGSDLDLWICHRGDLESGDLAALQAKCRAIEDWMAGFGLELHCFLVSPEALRRGIPPALSKESAGSTQHILLLEEFYRTAIHLAGQRPLWWLVPPEWEGRYREYADFLLGKRFIDPGGLIDLGGLEQLPTQELVSAGLWHLHKALDAPHKALLKLLLLLDYAADHPQPRWLATTIKAAVYAGPPDPFVLDPYLLLYHRATEAAQRTGSPALVQLARHCFALKIGDAERHPDYRRLTATLVQRGELSPPRRRGTLAITQALEEWQALTDALENAYATIRHLAGEPDSSTADMQRLTRRLQAVLGSRPGKVPVIRLQATPEPWLQLSRDPETERWQIALPGKSPTPLHQADTLLGALAWSWVNRLAVPATRWQLPPGTPVTAAELAALNRELRRFLQAAGEPELDAFARPARLQRALLAANPGRPTRPRRGDFEIASARFDPLDYGAERRSLLQTVEILTLNTWGEWESQRYQGLEGWFDALCHLYQQGGEALTLQSFCFSAPTLARRMTACYRQLTEALPAGHPAELTAAGRVYHFRQRRGRLVWYPLD